MQLYTRQMILQVSIAHEFVDQGQVLTFIAITNESHKVVVTNFDKVMNLVDQQNIQLVNYLICFQGNNNYLFGKLLNVIDGCSVQHLYCYLVSSQNSMINHTKPSFAVNFVEVFGNFLDLRIAVLILCQGRSRTCIETFGKEMVRKWK